MKQRSINPILPGGTGGAFIAPEHEQAPCPSWYVIYGT